jgi:3D (Asp-Asp-Asp) domain-containing protein
LAYVLLAGGLALPVFGERKPSKNGTYQATAYAVSGITASGEWTHRHVVAADPTVLPIGSRIKIKHARRYSGEYVVADTGAKIVGRRLDIYMPTKNECVKFGTRRVKILVVQVGDGTQAATKQADQAVKQDVDKDIAKGAVGNAATEVDWNQKGAKTVKAVESGTTPPPQK